MLRILLFLAVMIVTFSGYSAVVIKQDFQGAEINQQISVYAPQIQTKVTKKNALTLFQSEKLFVKNNANSVMLDNVTYGYWLKGKIAIEEQSPRSLILKLHYSHLGNATLFVKQQDGNLSEKHFYRGSIPEKNHEQLVDTDTAFNITVENTTAEFLLYIRPQGTSYNVYNVHVTLQTLEQYDSRKYADTSFISLVFGFIIAMFLYNFVLYLYVGYKPYIYYCGYLAALFSLDYTATGFGYTGIVNFSTATNVFLMSASPSFAYLFLVLFGRNILNLSSVYPRIDKFFKVAQWLCPISVLMLFTSFDSVNTLLLYSQLTATSLLAITAYKVHCKAKLPGAFFFSISFIFIVAGSLVHLSMEIWPLEEYISSPQTYKVYRWLEQKAFHVFTMVEMILLSLALASFIRQAELDKQQAQAEKLTLIMQTLTLKEQYANQLETEVKLRTYQLDQRNIELNKLQKIRDKFFAQMTHEFRSPLTLAIAPLSEIRQGKYGPLSDAFNRTLALIERNTLKMLTLVNSMLDLVRYNKHNLTVENSEINIALSLENIIDNYAFLVADKNITIKLNTPKIKTLTLWFDQQHFDAIINNLLSNACKHTPDKGTISLTYRILNHFLTIDITNTGSFISPEQQTYIFDYLYKNIGSTDKDSENSGIGLSYVKELLDLHQGNILVESDEELGTKFIVLLPYTAPDQEQLSEINHYVAQSAVENNEQALDALDESSARDKFSDQIQVLLIDDNKELLTYLSQVLIAANYQVVTAEDGKQGYQACLYHLPDIVVSDVVMPNMSGLELINAMRIHNDLKHIPIVLLTSEIEKEQQISGIKQGADEYLTKPFIPDELLAKLDRLIARRNSLKQQYLKKYFSGNKASSNAANNLPSNSSDNLKSDQADLKTKAEKIIYENLADSNFSVERLAELLFLSRSTLHRQLTDKHGISPNKLIVELRLSLAADLLSTEHNTESVANIAYAMGFNSQSYFAKKFNEKYGVTPRIWQKKHHVPVLAKSDTATKKAVDVSI